MPCAEWVNFSAACENVVAVFCAALVRPVSASVRWRMVASVAAVASAPPATELAARSTCLIIAPSSSSSSSRISLAESLSEVLQASATIVGVTACGSTAEAAGSGRRFRNKPNAMSRSREHENETGTLAYGHEVMVNDCLIFEHGALPTYQKTQPLFDLGRVM